MKQTHDTTRNMGNPIKRRLFLRYASASAGALTLTLTACDDDDEKMKHNNGIDLGSGDTGILNYAYALEQLEAAFYTIVVSHGSFSSIFSEEERSIFTDIRDHEIAHREFFKTALGTNAIQDLEVDFSGIDFGNKDSVLMAAKTFEDLGVAAYNGAGNLLTDVNLLLVAGKIVSVEARHAAIIRNMINPKSADFAGNDVVDQNGLDGALTPSEVLTAADAFIETKVSGSNLPSA